MFFFIIFTDNDLILFRSKDSEIMEKVFQEYNKQIFSYLVIKSNGNRHIAEELFSDTFHDMIKSASKLSDINKVYPWLLRIAKRRFLDHLRKKYREKKYQTDSEVDENYSVEKDLSEKLLEDEKVIMLKAALEKIKPDHKRILTLKYIENKSQKEISGILEKTESSIEGLLFRAREVLKKELKKSSKEFI